MLRLARLIAFFVIGVSVLVLLYGAYSFVLTRQLSHVMAVSNKVPVSFTRVKPYLDGVVIDTMHLGKDIRLSTVYFEAYPWNMLRNKIRHIYVKEAKIYADELLHKPVIWPFAHHIPLTVENMFVNFTALDRNITMTGEMKQSPQIPLLLKMSSTTPEVILSMQGEIRVQDSLVQSIDLEFHDAQTDFPSLASKRNSGWLSLTYDEAIWNIVGEIESGSVRLPQQSLYDMTVKLSGTTDHTLFSVSANERKSGKAWVFDRQKDVLDIRFLDQNKSIAWQGLDNALLQKIGSLMTTFEMPKEIPAKKEMDVTVVAKKQEIKKPVEKPKAKPKEAPKTEPKINPHVTQSGFLELPKDKKETAKENDNADAENIAQEKPVTGKTYVPIQDLTGNSIFAGFLYDRHLVFMPRVCVSNAETECWIARGQGGAFGYNGADPWAVPSYFSRMQDYREATRLRGLLTSVSITSLILSGDQNGVRDMIIQGRDKHGRNLHIELSLVGLSSD